MPGFPTELPGMRAFETAMAAPADIMGLATRQAAEAMGTLNIGVTRTLEALELPGLPPMTQMLPIGFGAPAPAAAPADRVSEAPVIRTAVTAAYGED